MSIDLIKEYYGQNITPMVLTPIKTLVYKSVKIIKDKYYRISNIKDEDIELSEYDFDIIPYNLLKRKVHIPKSILIDWLNNGDLKPIGKKREIIENHINKAKEIEEQIKKSIQEKSFEKGKDLLDLMVKYANHPYNSLTDKDYGYRYAEYISIIYSEKQNDGINNTIIIKWDSNNQSHTRIIDLNKMNVKYLPIRSENDELIRSSQGTRKIEGTKIERMVLKDLENIANPYHQFYINSHKGIDIYAKNGNTINIEVKSVKETIIERIKSGKDIIRSGRIWLKREDWINSDIFAFVIKKVNENNEWTGKVKIIYIDSNEVRKFIMEHNSYNKSSFKLNVNQIENFKKLDIKKLFSSNPKSSNIKNNKP